MRYQESLAIPPNPSVPYCISAGLATIFWLCIAGVGATGIVGSVTVVIGVATFGLLVLQWLCHDIADPDTRVLVAIGPGLGVGLLILFLLRAVAGDSPFVGIVILVVTIALIVRHRLVGRERSSAGAFTRIKTAVVSSTWMSFGAIGIIGLILHREWWWNFPIVIVGLVFCFVSRNATSSRSHFIVVLLGAALLLLASSWGTALRSEAWWVSSSNDDDAFFETWSHSLVQWGPLTNPSAIATSGPDAMAYHHLAYFLTGLVDIASSGEPFVALSRIVPVLLAVSTLGSTLLFSSTVARLLSNRKLCVTQFAVGAALFFALVSVAHPLSDFLASSLIIGVISIAHRVVNSTSLGRFAGLSILLVGSISFSKTAYIYVPVVALAVTALWSRRSITRAVVALASGAFFVGYFSLSGLYSNSFSLAFLSGSMVGEHAVGGLAARVLAIIYVLMPCSLGFVALLLVASSESWTSEIRSIWISLLLTMLSGMAFRVFLSTPEARVASYFIRPSLIAVGLSVVFYLLSRASSQAKQLQVPRVLFWAAILVGFWLVVLRNIVPDLSSGSVWAKSLRLLRDPQSLALATLAWLLLRQVLANRVRGSNTSFVSPQRSQRLSAAALSLVISVVVGVIPLGERIQERWEETKRGNEDELQNKAVLGSQSLFELAMVLRSTPDPDAVVAFSICDRECDPSGFRTPNLLSAYSRKKFLHAMGVTYIWGLSSSEEAKDYDLSRNMLKMDPLEVYNRLEVREVRYLVVDRQRAADDWVSDIKRAGALSVYQNSDFYLLEIATSRDD